MKTLAMTVAALALLGVTGANAQSDYPPPYGAPPAYGAPYQPPPVGVAPAPVGVVLFGAVEVVVDDAPVLGRLLLLEDE